MAPKGTRHLVALTLLIPVAAALVAAASSQDTRLGRMNAVVDGEASFSGVILVAEAGKPIYQRAVGYRDYENGERTRTDSIFEVASVSKQFTAMAIMLLKQEGRLDYEDPAERFLPGLPYAGISIRQLLNHTSGVPDYKPIMDEHWDRSKVATNQDILDYLKRHAPVARFAPGAKYEYSNTGYVLLASIVEKASGQDFAEFSRRRIFLHLGLGDTDIRNVKDWNSIERFAIGHVLDEQSGRYLHAVSLSKPNETVFLGGRYGPGRVSSTAADLLKWDRALKEARLISADALQEAFRPATLSDGSLSQYGFGWVLGNDSVLGRTAYHSGGNPGYTAYILRFLDADKTVIILSNNSYRRFGAIAGGIIAALRETKGPSPR